MRGLLLALGIACGSALAAQAGDVPLAERRSGYEQMTPELRRMQDDDSANPGMLWVLDGEAFWRRPEGSAQRSCADCHGDAAQSMNGVAARYPMLDKGLGRPVELEERINFCRVRQQGAPALAAESKELLSLTAYVARQSNDSPITVSEDPDTFAAIRSGEKIFERRQGQLNLSCANCHDTNSGGKLGGATIPQGHPNGYPLYRLEWQSVGSLQRRLRNCMIGMRAEPYPYGAEEYVALELFLMWRARGMNVETPAVRP